MWAIWRNKQFYPLVETNNLQPFPFLKKKEEEEKKEEKGGREGYTIQDWLEGRKKLPGKHKKRKGRQRQSLSDSNISQGDYLYSVAKENLELWKMNLTTT